MRKAALSAGVFLASLCFCVAALATPETLNIEIDPITESTALIGFHVQELSGADASITLRYGTTDGGPYPNSTSKSLSLGSFVTKTYETFELTELTPDTTYFGLIEAENNGVTTTEQFSFTTQSQ